MLQLPRRLVDGQYIKQDADDFIKFQGPQAFENLLSGSENGIEFRMAQVAGKFDLTKDDDRIASVSYTHLDVYKRQPTVSAKSVAK